MLCCVFGSLCPLPLISQHRTLLSQDPATRKLDAPTEACAGENLRQETESSGAETTSRSFMGLTAAAVAPAAAAPAVASVEVAAPPPKADAPPNEVWPKRDMLARAFYSLSLLALFSFILFPRRFFRSARLLVVFS